MRRIPQSKVVQGHPDYDLLVALANTVNHCAGSAEQFRADVPELIRRANDEIIDTPRTGRLVLDEVEKTEKTYLGTKIEILIRDFLGLPKGRLDLEIDGLDVDIKNTVGNNWMIPTEAIDKPCLLIASDEKTFLCYFGVFVARLTYLNPGANKDGKRSISAEGFGNIYWLLLNEPYPPNFWASVEAETAAYVNCMQSVGGTERIRRLFRRVTEMPISRYVVEGVARQKDYMKRLRKNGGARDPLLKEGIAILSGKYNSAAISELGLPFCTEDEFISVKIDPEKHEEILAKHGYFDY